MTPLPLSYFTQADIGRMRAVLNDSLAGTAVIQTRSWSDNAGGGGTLSWSNAGTADCRVASLTGTERELGNRIAEDATWVITLPATTSVTTDSRLVVTGSDHDGTYEVLAIRGNTPAVSKRVEAREVV